MLHFVLDNLFFFLNVFSIYSVLICSSVFCVNSWRLFKCSLAPLSFISIVVLMEETPIVKIPASDADFTPVGVSSRAMAESAFNPSRFNVVL